MVKELDADDGCHRFYVTYRAKYLAVKVVEGFGGIFLALSLDN